MLLVLEQLLPGCRVHAQVAMGALLAPPDHKERTVAHWERNAYAQKIADFVVQDRTAGEVLTLVEVDDQSHNSKRDRERDAMTSAAGYRTVRIPGSVKPTVQEIAPIFGVSDASGVSSDTTARHGRRRAKASDDVSGSAPRG